MTQLVGLLIILALIAVLFRTPAIQDWLRSLHSGGGEPSLPYKARPYLLTKGEAAFYHTLRRAVGDRYAISMKVRLTDVLRCSKEAWRSGYGNRISQKHVDFVLCDPNTTKIVAVIELDDQSHRRSDRRERDEFLDAAMNAAGLPIIRFMAAMQYDLSTVAATIDETLEGCGSASPSAT